jgi:hypothetical protein
MYSSLYLLPVLFAGLLLVAQQPSKSTMRQEIESGYRQWEKARLSYDEATFNKMLAPDFYVLLNGKRENREAFIGMIMNKGAKLVRFDSHIQTLSPSEDTWVAVITEKIEWEVTDQSGKTAKVYSMWVTKDGWRKKGDAWQILYSEAVGNENWREKPPFADW